MRFQHEKEEVLIEYHEERIAIIKGKLRDKEWIQKHALLWQVANDGKLIICDATGLSEDDVYAVSSAYYVQFKVDGLSQFQFEKIMDGIDEILEAEGFEIDLGLSQFNVCLKEYKFVYYKDNKTSIEVDFSSRTCERVATGKMVPEYKERCKLFAA